MFVNKKPKSKVLALVLGASLLGPLACNDNHFQPGAMTKDEPSVAQPESRDAAAAQPPTPIPDPVLPEPTPEDPIVVPLPAATVALETSRKPDTTINSFASSAIKDSSIKFSLSPKGISSNFTLSDIISPRSDSFTQLTRTSLTDSFKQGNPGQPVSQSFAQNARKGLVDILVVIDNSGSMGEEQKGLSTKLNELLVSVKDSNWQLSVINTSPVMQTGYTEATEGKEVCTTTLIKSGEADASTKFAAAINAGLTGTGNEQGIRQAVVGLRCTEKPWVRPGSTLAVLIVSDEDNCSDGTGCGSLPWANESYLSNYVENTMKRTIGKDAGFFGIVSPSKALCATQGNTATQYMKLFAYKSTAMNYGNICDADYKPTLNRISDSIALLLDAKFEIQSLPDAGSLGLTLMLKDGSKSLVPASNYMLSGKTIEFKAGMEPPASSTIIANYLVGAKP
ncbi:MAG: hypothetical protein NTX25_15485, partial [Proteobacteria bacterium]|nr:hypothetical protein [Pseudomonadota bacterium]